MTVGVRGALVRFRLLCGGAVVFLTRWQSRAAGAQEGPAIEPTLPAVVSAP